MNYAISSAAMKGFDSRACEIIPEMVLMENAGRLIAEYLLRDIRARQVEVVSFLVGPGHNGGDGLVAARHLNDGGVAVRVFMTAAELKPLTHSMAKALDPSMTKMSFLAETSCDELCDLLRSDPARHHLFVDAFLGGGTNRPLSAAACGFDLLKLIQSWNESDAPRYAVDLPSGSWGEGEGWDGSWGEGESESEGGSGKEADWPVFQADYTLAIQFPRDILFTQPLRTFCGEIYCLKIGFPAALLRDYCARPQEYAMRPLLDHDDLPRLIQKMPASAHKGRRGRVEVFAGSAGMAGAALLAARAALHSGAGLLRLACAEADITSMVLEHEPALMSAGDMVPGSWGDGILAGPGWGKQTEELLAAVMRSDIPVVVDADGIAGLRSLLEAEGTAYFKQRKAELILSPHPGEAAYLLNSSVAEVLRHPFEATSAIAARYNAWVVLKSAISYISDPAARIRIFDGQLPALGTAGSGDVLAGILVGLLARGQSADTATAGAVLLHAAAGRRCFMSCGWFSAGQLLACLGRVAGEIQYQQSPDMGSWPQS